MDIVDLYGLIPDVMCVRGCTRCCSNFGVPSRTKIEDERLREFLKERGGSIGEAQGNTCPYVSDTGCTIYPVRPLTCRLYGASANYLCSHGGRPMRPLDEDEEAEILHMYQANFFP